jgi:cysteinyl-tRNA synthetase
MVVRFFKKTDTSMPPLRLHNTLSGQAEEFKPLNGVVKMYNCGPTVYDRQHIGNLFSQLFANTLRRTLDQWGYDVKQVVNLTDFGHLSGDNEGDADEGEDRMSRGLKREGLALTLPNMRILAEKYAQTFFDDIEQLGVDLSKITFPRASDYIPEQIALIETLQEKGYAYQTSNGVYFDTAKFSDYGKLGGINLAGQQEGARVEINKEKRNPADFILWKSDKKLGWESPWGLGFPGWHIECTAMIFKLLGKQIDIHTGGIEHIPVHHNNEIAQAEAATGKQFVRYWMHNAHITIEGKKISKSLGNTVYLHNLTDHGLSSRALRYWALTGHYRTPMNFTWEAIEGANTALGRLTRAYHELPPSGMPVNAEFLKDFHAAIANDLNTAQALAHVWDMVKNPDISPTVKRVSLLEADKILGLGFSEPQKTIKMHVSEAQTVPAEVTLLLQEREEARKNKDFSKADELRQKIKGLGYEIEDTSGGPKITKI